MLSEHSKRKLSSTKTPRALRARQAFFAELFLAIFAEHVNFAFIFSSVAIVVLSTVLASPVYEVFTNI